MKLYIHFLLLCAGGSLVLFLQQSRLLELYGINPNFFLIFLLVLVFYGKTSFPYGVSLGIFFLLFSLFLFPFFKIWIGAVLFVFFIALFLRKKMTGNTPVDFFLWIVFGTVLFYGISEGISNIYEYGINIADFSFFFHTFFVKEVLLNILYAAIVWGVVAKTVVLPRRISRS
jgi:hypothetical protein